MAISGRHASSTEDEAPLLVGVSDSASGDSSNLLRGSIRLRTVETKNGAETGECFRSTSYEQL